MISFLATFAIAYLLTMLWVVLDNPELFVESVVPAALLSLIVSEVVYLLMLLVKIAFGPT